MAKFAVILFAAFAFQAVLAAPKKGEEKTQLEQVSDQIQTVANDITATLQKNIPDTKDIIDSIKTHSQEFAHNIEPVVKKIQTEIDNNKGKADGILKEVSGKLSETIASIQELSGPDATKKANELRTELENQVKTAAAELEKLGKTVQPNLQQAGDSVNTFAKGVLDDFLKAAQTFQTQVKDAVDKH